MLTILRPRRPNPSLTQLRQTPTRAHTDPDQGAPRVQTPAGKHQINTATTPAKLGSNPISATRNPAILGNEAGGSQKNGQVLAKIGIVNSLAAAQRFSASDGQTRDATFLQDLLFLGMRSGMRSAIPCAQEWGAGLARVLSSNLFFHAADNYSE